MQHGALVGKRLHTTVEEDASTKARLCGLSAKLEAAGSERLQLEHRLKLQRLEQAKAMNTLQVGPAAAAQHCWHAMLAMLIRVSVNTSV